MRLFHASIAIFALACSSSFDPNKDEGPPTIESEDDGDGGDEGADGSIDEPDDDDTDADGDDGGGDDADADADGGSGDDGGASSGGDDGGSTGSGSGEITDCDLGPVHGFVPTDEACSYTPSGSGGTFLARIEWAMTHGSVDTTDGTEHPAYIFEEYPTLDSVFQSPVVAQFTDDNADAMANEWDMPDIAVLMGDEFAEYTTADDRWSAIRIISGDGSEVHGSVLWDEFEGFTYAPYLFAGLATADLNVDGVKELVTIVRQPDDATTCYIGVYEVGLYGDIDLIRVSSDTISCESHSPAVADIDRNGSTEIVVGSRVYDASLNIINPEASGGQGWFNYGAVGASTDRTGYWNSGYHSFAYDMDGDGTNMEIVAGSTIYNNDGTVFCNIDGGDIADGYPAVADFDGDEQPEIVITGNRQVNVYSGTPVSGLCDLISTNENDPYLDMGLPSGIPAHPSCDSTRAAFGGQPTIADFTGDGTLEVGVAGSCWYSIFDYTGDATFERIAMTQTRDWSSASTGSTVFDFNGDGANEVVFSDEDAVYVWGYNDSPGLAPWDRMDTLLKDENHKSWTIHEYPLVADVDGDGKAEIVAVNSHLPEAPGSTTPTEHYGIYVIGEFNDNWVSARSMWNQHAYYVTNVDDDASVGYGAPNYAPYTPEDYNSFRAQAPGSFGVNAAANLYPEVTTCQDECGAVTVWVQIANEGAFIAAREDLAVTLYGMRGGSSTELDAQLMPWRIDPGTLSKGIDFDLPAAIWTAFDSFYVIVDDPAYDESEWGGARECNEADNAASFELSDFCP